MEEIYLISNHRSNTVVEIYIIANPVIEIYLINNLSSDPIDEIYLTDNPRANSIVQI